MSSDSRSHFAALQKLNALHRAVGSGTYPSLDALASAIEVSRRSVLRYLEHLREMGAPLAYDRTNRGYFFTDRFWQMPAQKLTEGDMLAFFIAEQSLKFIGHDEYAARLRSSLGRFASLLPEYISVSVSALASGVSFQALPFAAVDPAALELIAQATIEQETIAFDYFSPHKSENTVREVDVHLLHNFAGDWYAVSFDPSIKEFRDFHIARMSNLRKTGRGFERQSDWSATEHLRSGFFMMRGGKLTTVEVVFDSYQSQWIRERMNFHPDETREELPDGELKLSFKVGEKGLEAVARFCLTYADHCRVLRPPELISLVRKKLKKAQELNS